MAQQALSAGLDDLELLQQAGAQDAQALSVLYDRFAQPLFTVACRILGSRLEAEEEVVDLFRQIWQATLRHDAKAGPVDVWLFAMMRRRALDRLRHLRQSGRRGDDGLAADLAVPPAPLAAERREVIAAALATLPAGPRDVVELAYYRGLKLDDIALLTDKHPDDVRQMARQGLERLHYLLSHLWGTGV